MASNDDFFVPTNPDLANILGDTDLDFENYYLTTILNELDPKCPDFQVPRFPNFQTGLWPGLVLGPGQTRPPWASWPASCTAVD